MEGWICLHRKILENPVICKDSDYFSIFSYLLLSATHEERSVLFNNSTIILKKGQLITGRKKISDKFEISESKVQRVLKKLENEQVIEQQTTSKNRLITVLNWNRYQLREQQNEQQVNNKRTTNEQRVNTNNNETMKQLNNIYINIIKRLNEKANTNYKETTKKTIGLINDRFRDGFKEEDFYKVIDNKTKEWNNTEMAKYLRPETLFRK